MHFLNIILILHICMYVCVCMYVYIYIYIYIYNKSPINTRFSCDKYCNEFRKTLQFRRSD